MNALYVGVTRAISDVYVIDDKSHLLKIIEPKEEGNVNIEAEKSSPEEWRNKALELIEKGNIEQAELIARKLQNEEKKEYAEEVTNALRTNRYHEEDQILDKNKHTNSVLESDISSRFSQSSEHEGDDISKPQNEKGKHNQNKKKKAKKRYQVQEVKPQLSLEDSTNRKHNSKKPQNERYKQDLNDEKESKRLEKNTNELFLALANGNLKKAKRLIEKGVNVHARNQKGAIPLHLAAGKGQDKVIELLLEKGADVDARSKKDVTPLHLAAQEGQDKVVELLLNKVELLLQHGSDVNAREDEEGYTPLHLAAGKGQDKVVELLLEKGADVDAKSSLGNTPLYFAAINGHLNVVEKLIEKGANVKSSNSYTPLSLALKHGCSNVVDLLLADPNINVGCIDLKSVKNEGDKRKCVIKKVQDGELFNKVKEVANEKDTGKLDELLVEIEELLESKNKHGFKPSLNYSPNGNDENTTVEIAIKAGEKLLDLLYDYAGKNIGTDTEIFERLKKAKENSQSKGDLCDVSVLKHSTSDQGFVFSNGCRMT